MTSPILADAILCDADRRIGVACEKSRLRYTRFVDDIFVSGPFDLETSGFPSLVERILFENGFVAHPGKRQFGRPEDGVTLTNLRFHRGHPDVSKAYCDELVRQIDDLASLGRGEAFVGPYFTQGQVWGRVRYVCRVNPGRTRLLRAMLARVDWSRVSEEAERRGLVAVRKSLVPAPGDESTSQ